MGDPAVLFYTSDFLTGVMDMTMEERGQYITLLCYQHQKGHIKEETIWLLVGSVSVNVLNHFIKDEEGKYYNKRMDLEKEKRHKYAESRRENGKKGGRPSLKKDKAYGKPTKNHMDNHMHNHMGNENEDVNINNINTINNINNIDIYSYIEEQLNRPLSSAEIELIQTWEDNELTRYAVKQTVLARANSLKYTQAILNGYKQKGIKTLLDAEKEKEDFEKKKQEPKKSIKEKKFDEQIKMINECFEGDEKNE